MRGPNSPAAPGLRGAGAGSSAPFLLPLLRSGAVSGLRRRRRREPSPPPASPPFAAGRAASPRPVTGFPAPTWLLLLPPPPSPRRGSPPPSGRGPSSGAGHRAVPGAERAASAEPGRAGQGRELRGAEPSRAAPLRCGLPPPPPARAEPAPPAARAQEGPGGGPAAGDT